MHLFHRAYRYSAMSHGQADVLESRLPDHRRLVEASRFHGIAIVQHDLTARGFEGRELPVSRLTASHPTLNGLGGVRETGERREHGRHLRIGMRNAEFGMRKCTAMVLGTKQRDR